MNAQSTTHRTDAILLLLGRILLTAIFLPSGLSKLNGFSGFAAMLAGKGLPYPEAWAAAAIAAECGVALLILAGLFTRHAALIMAVYTAAAAVIGHPFWAVAASEHDQQYINFMKNMAIIGGFLALSAAGPGVISLDAMLRWRR